MHLKKLCKLFLISNLSLSLLFSTSIIKATEITSQEEPNQISSSVCNGDSLGDCNEIIPSEKEQLEEILSDTTLTEHQRESAEGKLDALKGKMTRGVYPAKTIPVTCFDQSTSYYCGPATTKQTMHYITGKSDSQDKIAKALNTTTAGTDGHNIVSYLNAHQTRSNYIIATNPSTSDFKTKLDVSIRNYNIPPIVRARFSKTGSWSYPTDGHYMNISGFDKNISHVELTDPNIRRANKSNHTGKYYVTIGEIIKAINDHPRQEYYW